MFLYSPLSLSLRVICKRVKKEGREEKNKANKAGNKAGVINQIKCMAV